MKDKISQFDIEHHINTAHELTTQYASLIEKCEQQYAKINDHLMILRLLDKMIHQKEINYMTKQELDFFKNKIINLPGSEPDTSITKERVSDIVENAKMEMQELTDLYKHKEGSDYWSMMFELQSAKHSLNELSMDLPELRSISRNISSKEKQATFTDLNEKIKFQLKTIEGLTQRFESIESRFYEIRNRNDFNVKDTVKKAIDQQIHLMPNFSVKPTALKQKKSMNGHITIVVKTTPNIQAKVKEKLIIGDRASLQKKVDDNQKKQGKLKELMVFIHRMEVEMQTALPEKYKFNLFSGKNSSIKNNKILAHVKKSINHYKDELASAKSTSASIEEKLRFLHHELDKAINIKPDSDFSHVLQKFKKAISFVTDENHIKNNRRPIN